MNLVRTRTRWSEVFEPTVLMCFLHACDVSGCLSSCPTVVLSTNLQKAENNALTSRILVTECVKHAVKQLQDTNALTSKMNARTVMSSPSHHGDLWWPFTHFLELRLSWKALNTSRWTESRHFLFPRSIPASTRTAEMLGWCCHSSRMTQRWSNQQEERLLDQIRGLKETGLKISHGSRFLKSFLDDHTFQTSDCIYIRVGRKLQVLPVRPWWTTAAGEIN